jgi:hypothetical protein
MNPWNKNLHGKEYLNHYKDKKIWNTGLTKETDERVKKQSEKIVGHKVLPVLGKQNGKNINN